MKARKAVAKPERKALPRITAMALDTAKRRRVVNPFKFPEFPPGVKPINRTMARDSSLAAVSSWAAQGGGWGAAVFQQGLEFLGYPYLAELSQRPEYRVISETIAAESTRKGIKFESANTDGSNEDKIKAIADAFNELKVLDRFKTSSEQDGFFGRAHLYIDTGDTDDPDELKLPIGDGHNKISQNKVSPERPVIRLVNVEPVWTYPTSYNSNDPLDPRWYNPEHWFVMGKQLHKSRLLTFVARPVPDLLKPSYSFGGLAMSQMVKPAVDNWLRTRGSVADLISAFSVMGLKTNMAESLAADGEQAFARAELFTATRDNRGTMLIDKDTEEFFNVSAPLGTLDQLQAQAQEHMAAISRIPLVKLLGISPHGLNASSEGEIRVWYDWVEAYQKLFHLPNLNRILGFVQLSLFGKVDPSITIKFEELWALDEKQAAEVEKIRSETDTINIDNGTIDPKEARKRIANDAGTQYQGIDADDMPEPPEDEGDAHEPDAGFGKNEGGSAEEGADDTFLSNDEFHESDHPRGQPGNAGQFGSGGGSQKIEIKGAPKAQTVPISGGEGGGAQGSTHSMQVAKVLAQPAGISNSFRAFIKELIDKTKSLGGDHKPLVKKLAESYANKAQQMKNKGELNEALKYKAKAEKLGHSFGEKETPPVEKKPEKEGNPGLYSSQQLEKAKGKNALPVPAGERIDPAYIEAVKNFNQEFTGANAPKDDKQAAAKIETFQALQKMPKEKKSEGTYPAEEQASYKELEAILSYGSASGYFKTSKALIAQNSLPLSVGAGAHILAYTGNQYTETNQSLRKGVMTEERWAHVKALNDALGELPPYSGVTHRGAVLDKEQVKMFQVGMIVEERGFMSTAKTTKKAWGGTQFEVHGKNGRDISKISLHSGEQEVLFRSGTRFKVVSNDGKKIVVHEV